MKSTYEAYYDSPQPIRNLVDSGIIGDLVEKILHDTPFIFLKSKVIITSTRYIISLTSSRELSSELSSLNISSKVIQSLINELTKTLDSSLGMISGSIASTSEEIKSIEEALLQRDYKYQAVLSANDTESTYSSTQSAILQDSLHNLPVSGETSK